MRYSYEFKQKCVEMYRSGQWPATPEGVRQTRFRATIHEWACIEDAYGPEALKSRNSKKAWMPEERLDLVMQIIAGKSNRSAAIEKGIDDGMLCGCFPSSPPKPYTAAHRRHNGRNTSVPQASNISALHPPAFVQQLRFHAVDKESWSSSVQYKGPPKPAGLSFDHFIMDWDLSTPEINIRNPI